MGAIRESVTRKVWRAAMRSAERRIDRAGELGRRLPDGVPANTPPAVLVHGYGNTSASMRGIERSLARDGWDVHALDLPNFGFGDLMDDARVLDEFIRRVQLETGAEVVDTVGHSRGGIVARVRQQLLDGGSGNGRVVTVSSANGGIDLGIMDRPLAWLLPDGMQQIRAGSEAIVQLHGTRTGHDLVAVGTLGMDGVLMPASAARIEGAPFLPVDEGRTIGPLSRVGHYGILRDGVAYETLRGALLRPRPA